MGTLEFVAQSGIILFGITALILISRKNKWGFVFGLLSQPFWLLTALHNKQWGVVLLTFLYGFSWAYGIYRWFYKKSKGNIIYLKPPPIGAIFKGPNPNGA